MPYPDYVRSARALDNKRLGQQRNEAYTILENVLEKDTGWIHHPAVKMWEYWPESLAAYGIIVCEVWVERPTKTRPYRIDSVADKIRKLMKENWLTPDSSQKMRPPWVGDELFHKSHQSNLVRKGYEKYLKTNDVELYKWYRDQFPDVPVDMEYVWPTL